MNRPFARVGLAVALALSLGCAVVPATAAGLDDSLSTKQPYRNVTGTLSAVPEGFHAVNTQVVARHGSRGLSSFKYDALTEMVWEQAKKENAILPLGQDLWEQTEKIHQANVALGNEATWAEMATDEVELTDGTFAKGYGNLTGVGATQHRQLGARLVARMPELFDGQGGVTVDVQSSGEPRAAESGFNFVKGVLAAAPQMSGHIPLGIKARQSTLYFHKDPANPDYAAYTAYADGDQVAAYVDAVNARPEVKAAARAVLEKIYTKDFVDRLEKKEWTFKTPEGKKVKNEVDAALQLYNLYIIAPSMAEEVTTDFAKYFTQEQANAFAMALDAEDYAQKGPAFVGSDIAYRNAAPLLADFFAAIDKQVAAHPEGSATLRFGHAETLIPFEALIEAPGSRTQVRPDQTDLWAATEWRGAEVSPMAANVQWDVFADARGQRVVRMLLNEQEATFGRGCRPVATGSVFYTEDELKRCLTGATVADTAWQLLPVEKPAGEKTPAATATPSATPTTGTTGNPGLARTGSRR